MTSPNVGSVEVTIVASAKGLAQSIRAEIESAFKGLDFDKLIRDSVGNTRIKVPVSPDVKTDEIPAKVRATKAPKVPVELDPVLSAFQAGVRSQLAALARTINAKIPVGADTAGLRADLSASLAEVRRSVSVDVPTEPGGRAEYEAKLKAQLAEVSHRVKQSVPVEPKVGSLDLSGIAGLAGKLTPNLLGGGAVSAIGTAFQGLGEAVTKFTASAAEGGSQLAASIGAAAGPVAAIVGGILSAQAAVVALGGATTVLVPAFTAAAGAAAAIPGALAGLGAVFGTLSLGFKGISEAFKPKAGGGAGAGQSAAQQARQVAAASRQVEAARRGIGAANRAAEASERSLAAAERGMVTAQRNLADAEDAVAQAQKRAQVAQVAVNKARLEAADDLIDLNLQLKGSQLSEQEAAQAVTDSLRELNAVKLTGNIPDIQKADLAYQRAQLTLEQATQSTKELGKQSADANAKGVEGSDKVQSALREQQDALQGVHKAQEGVLDAQNGILDAADSLKSAQDGVASAADGIKSATDSLASAQDALASATTKQGAAASAAAAKLIPLAPAAQRFVNALKALKPAFEDLRLDVQQRLFEGLDRTVTHLGQAWIPALKTTLGSYADTFNGFFRSLGAAITTPKFISDIQAGAEGARQGMAAVGQAITNSLVPAFGALSRASAPFLTQLGKEIAAIVTDFSNWVLAGEKTGGLDRFFTRATTALHEIFTTGRLVGAIIGDLFSIITGSQGTGRTALDSLNDGLQKVDTWLKDPKHQQQIRDLITDLQNAFVAFGQLASKINSALTAVSGGSGAGGIGRTIGAALIAGLLTGVGDAMKASLTTFIRYFSPFGPLVAGIKDVLGIHSPSTVFAEIGADLIHGLIAGIEVTFGALLAAAGQIPAVAIGAVGNAATWLVAHGKNAVIGFINGVGSLLGTLAGYAGNIRVTVVNALRDAGSWLVAHGANAVIGVINGIGGRLGQLGSAARNIAATVLGSLGGLYEQALGYGKNIMIGLYNGLVSLGSWLYSRVYSLIQSVIPAPIRAVLGIASPSKVAAELGSFVGQGLAQGLTAEGGRVQAAAEEIAARATPNIPDVTLGLGQLADAKLSAALQSSNTQQVQLSWINGATADPLLRAFQSLINVQYRGDVQAAFTGS